MNQYFDTTYCLNQDSRPDRWAQAKGEFDRTGIRAERFPTIPADHPHHSFCLSQYAMLKSFLRTNGRTLLTLEDDVLFQSAGHLEAAISELPADWDIIYLGANITEGVVGIKEKPPVRHSEHLHRVRRAWTTHAIAYSRKAVEEIVGLYPVHTFDMFDNWLNQNYLENHQCFLVSPMIAWQRPVFSDLWGNAADYTGAFEWGNKYMEA